MVKAILNFEKQCLTLAQSAAAKQRQRLLS